MRKIINPEMNINTVFIKSNINTVINKVNWEYALLTDIKLENKDEILNHYKSLLFYFSPEDTNLYNNWSDEKKKSTKFTYIDGVKPLEEIKATVFVKGSIITPSRFWEYALLTDDNLENKDEIFKAMKMSNYIFSEIDTKLYNSWNDDEKKLAKFTYIDGVKVEIKKEKHKNPLKVLVKLESRNDGKKFSVIETNDEYDNDYVMSKKSLFTNLLVRLLLKKYHTNDEKYLGFEWIEN